MADKEHLRVELPLGLLDQVRSQAEENGRTLTSEINHILERSFIIEEAVRGINNAASRHIKKRLGVHNG